MLANIVERTGSGLKQLLMMSLCGTKDMAMFQTNLLIVLSIPVTSDVRNVKVIGQDNKINRLRNCCLCKSEWGKKQFKQKLKCLTQTIYTKQV